MDLSVVPYKRHHQQRSANNKAENESEDGDVVEPKNNNTAANNNLNNKNNILNSNRNDVVKYRECMRNHAASIGGHANDGCGEFMPSSAAAESNDSSLTCAACGCHRNFHRREVIGCDQAHSHHQQQPSLLYPVHSPPPPPPMLLYNPCATTPRWDPKMSSVVGPPRRHQIHSLHRNGGGGRGIVEAREGHAEGGAEIREYYDRRSSETPEREDVSGPAALAGSGGGKRFRTKFTQEQKDRMLAFAERIGWRIQRQDEVAINQFCSEVGVRRNVLKVWMHNNKNAHRRRESAPPSFAEAPTPPTPQAAGV